MTNRVVTWGNQNPFLMSLILNSILVLVMGGAIVAEGRQRAADLEREQAEDAEVLVAEATARSNAVIQICETFAARVEATFHETYETLAERSAALGRPAPAVWGELDAIAAKNLNPAFCSPPALEESPTTVP